MNPGWFDWQALTGALGALHFLRPGWLWALWVLPPLAWWWSIRRRKRNAWRDSVDPHLLVHLLEGRGRARRGWLGLVFAALAGVLAVLALAGPSWRQTPQPLWQDRTPLVIALDLSSAALAGDLPPSRLAQARAKLDTLLRERDGGQVGLVAYAGDAYTVSPLTRDAANVALFLDALHPDIMPVDGQRADRAIGWSAQLLRQAGFDRGRIMLLTGHVGADAIAAAAEARADGYTVSVLGLGSATGAPYRRRGGRITHAQLDSASLKQLVRAGGGRYAKLQPGDADLRALGVLDARSIDGASVNDQSGRAWKDDGYWLLLPLMLLALFAFRRRSGAVAVLLVCAVLPWQPASAVELWQRPDQIVHETLQRGAQAYRQDDYKRAAQLYGRVETADGHYNRGNALAKSGQYREAIQAYAHALAAQPAMADALANKRAVEALLQRKQSQAENSPQPSGTNAKPGDAGKPKPGGTPKQDANAKSSAKSRSGDQRKPGAKPKPGGTPKQDGEPDQAGKGSQSSAARGATEEPESNARTSVNPPAPSDSPSPPPQPADAQAQQSANQAQRERMRRALERSDGEPRQSGRAQAGSRPGETAAQRERRVANQAWLNRVPDDPGGLLREKFRLEHQRRRSAGWGE